MTDEKRNVKDERNEKLFKEVIGIYMGSNTVFGSIRDGVLNIKTFVTPGAFISTTVFPERGGFLIRTRYFVGTKVGRLNLIEEVNAINNKLRQGGMYVEDDGGLVFKTFIPDCGDCTSAEIVNGVKMSIVTFLENLDEIMEIIITMEGLTDDNYTIIDVDDAEEGASS